VAKIRKIANEQLKKYLQVYEYYFKLDPSDSDLEFKTKCIKAAIQNRELLGIKKQTSEETGMMTKIFQKMKKGKE